MQAQHGSQLPVDAIEFTTDPTKIRGVSRSEHKAFSLEPVLSGELFHSLVQYGVIVEMWDKKKSGRVKRAYLQEFDEAERKLLSRWQQMFYRWHMHSGTPQRISMRLGSLELLQRAVNFFATI